MSSRPSEGPLRLEPRPSRRLAALTLAAHAGAAAVGLALPVPPAVRLLLFAAVAVSLVRVWPALARQVVVTWDPEGQWWWCEGDREHPVRLRADSYCSPALVVLRLEAPRWRRELVLLPDSLDGERLRRLRARLRLEEAGEGRE